MNTDSFRVEAQLVARNRAQAANNRPPEADFSSALDQASRRTSETTLRVETSPFASQDSSASPRPTTGRGIDRPPGGRAEEEKPDDRSTATPPATENETSATTAAESGPSVHGSPSPQTTELKRLLKQFQDNKAATRTLQNPHSSAPSDAPVDEASPVAPGRVADGQRAFADPEQASSETARLGDPLIASHSPTTIPQASTPAAIATAQHREPPSLTPHPRDPAASERPDLNLPSGPQASKSPRGATVTLGGSADSSTPIGAALQRSTDTRFAIEAGVLAGGDAALAARAGLSDASSTQSPLANLIPLTASAHPGLSAFSAPGATGASSTDPVQWRLPFAPGDLRFGEALGERLSWMIRDGLQQAEITLNPRELGPIRIALTMQGDAAQLGLQADHPWTRQTIEDALPRLKDLLAEQGVQLGQTTVGDGAARQADAESRHGHREGRPRDSQRHAENGHDLPPSQEPGLRTGQVPLRSSSSGRIDVFV